MRKFMKSKIPKRKTKKSGVKSGNMTTVSASVKKYVKRTLHSNIENKTIKVSSANNVVTTYTFNTGLTTVSMIPYTSWTQGVGQGDRLSNTVKTRSCIFQFLLRPAPYSSVTNAVPVPQLVLMFFGKVKNSKPLQPVSTDYQKIWQNGDSVNGFYSNTLDMLQEVNKDWFSVYKILKFKVAPASINGLGINTAFQYYNNNDFKFNIIRRINLTKYCPKTVKFNDTTNQPTNDGLWMWACCVNADGSGGASTIPLYMDYSISYTWEDA